MTAKRDYKKEYAKFQSSPEKKKYRAELNKYNRDKGTYGNGDGKDASHKGGKISGYEAEGKNRGRREKSRLKGSKRKTEGVAMPTLREFIIREANAELDERLSKRWNIVDSVGPSWGGETADGQTVVSPRDIKQAVEDGDAGAILQVIKQVVSLRRKGTIDASSDDTLKKLLRIFIHVRKNSGIADDTITEAPSWGGPDVKAKELQSKEVEPKPISELHVLTEDPDQPRCSNCGSYEGGQGQKGHCSILTPPDVVPGGWCKYWHHWDASVPRFQAHLARKNMRVGQAGAKYTNRGPNESVNEGFMGWEHYEESDTASDHYHNLKSIYLQHKGNRDALSSALNDWLTSIKRDGGNEYNLAGHHSLALIAKEPLFKQVFRGLPLNLKQYASWAARLLGKDLRWAEAAKRAGKGGAGIDDQIQGLKGMLQSIKKLG